MSDDGIEIVSGGAPYNSMMHYIYSMSSEDIKQVDTFGFSIFLFENLIENIVYAESVKIDNIDVCPILGIMDKQMVLIDDISTPVSMEYLKTCLKKAKDFSEAGDKISALRVLLNPYTRKFIIKMRLAK